MFDVRHLRFAIAAADHGSFYRAAQALDVEQSTLSRSILRLERIAGAKLFDRSRTGVKATIAGERFIRGARTIVNNAECMLAASRAAGQGRAGLLMLGLNSSVSAGNLRATIVAWTHDHPDVELEVLEAERGALLAGLNSGEIDIAILLGEACHRGFRREPFWSEPIVAALAQSNPLSDHESLLWTDLRAQRFVLPAADPGSDIRDLLLGRLSSAGSTPDIRMNRSSRETVLSLLGEGRSVSVVCGGATGAHYPDIVYRQIHGEQGPALTVYSGYWRSDNDNPPLRRFLKFVRSRYALSFAVSDAATRLPEERTSP
jgi:DNA-binding transcriptional LysR family regulator